MRGWNVLCSSRHIRPNDVQVQELQQALPLALSQTLCKLQVPKPEGAGRRWVVPLDYMFVAKKDKHARPLDFIESTLIMYVLAPQHAVVFVQQAFFARVADLFTAPIGVPTTAVNFFPHM